MVRVMPEGQRSCPVLPPRVAPLVPPTVVFRLAEVPPTVAPLVTLRLPPRLAAPEFLPPVEPPAGLAFSELLDATAVPPLEAAGSLLVLPEPPLPVPPMALGSEESPVWVSRAVERWFGAPPLPTVDRAGSDFDPPCPPRADASSPLPPMARLETVTRPVDDPEPAGAVFSGSRSELPHPTKHDRYAQAIRVRCIARHRDRLNRWLISSSLSVRTKRQLFGREEPLRRTSLLMPRDTDSITLLGRLLLARAAALVACCHIDRPYCELRGKCFGFSSTTEPTQGIMPQ